MAFAGFGKTTLTYDMFDFERSADEAKRFVKCENIYHRGQELAWDGKDVLAELIAEHGKPRIDDPVRLRALGRLFNMILWGELAAWKISAQLAERVEPLEAKMAATSQAHDEARHFFVMYDYLTALGYKPTPLDRAPQALLDSVLEADDLTVKLIGMQLMVEALALTIFQTVRELDVEPVLSGLMRYYERDEARHVGLGMQFLPNLLAGKSKAGLLAVGFKQVRIMMWGLAELIVMKPDLVVLGIEPRMLIERARRKQMAAMNVAYGQAGINLNEFRNPAAMAMNALIELAFPTEPGTSWAGRSRTAWRAFWGRDAPGDLDEIRVHLHTIKTARGAEVGVNSSDEISGEPVPSRSS